MNRNWIRGAAGLLVLGALAACHKANDDQTETAAQGGTTGSAGQARRGARESAGSNGRYQPGQKAVAGKTGGLFARHEYTLASGAALTAVSEGTLSSRTSHAGDRVLARVEVARLSGTGDTVVPYGAELIGRIVDIRPAPHPDQWGTLHLAFDSVRMNGATMPLSTKVDSMRTEMRGRGVTTTDAAKVGAGAVVGGIVGRLVGGNATGTLVGAAAGGTAGGVVAHNTRTVDIVLPAGAAIHLQLTQSFDRPRAVASSR